MKVDYDSEEDVLYLHFKEGPTAEVKEIEDDVVIEFDGKGEVMGVEVWGAGRRGLLHQFARIPSQN